MPRDNFRAKNGGGGFRELREKFFWLKTSEVVFGRLRTILENWKRGTGTGCLGTIV